MHVRKHLDNRPSLGLSPLLADFIFDVIRDIRQRLKFSILLWNREPLKLWNSVTEAIYILESGRITTSNDRVTLMSNPMVQKAYLGTG